MLGLLLACAEAPPEDSLTVAPVIVAPTSRVPVGPAIFRGAFATEDSPIPRFALDRTPVTNQQFLAFVQTHPEWRSDRVARIFADEGFLHAWADPSHLGDANPDAPAVWVSWYAARAYCAANGGRLPLEAEWELAAAASETAYDARRDPIFRDRILGWYSAGGARVLPRVGLGVPNLWGVQDLHGLVWEWVEDFGGAMVASDARSDRKSDDTTFCGGGALGAQARDDYPAFMRQAMRSSLRAPYTTGTLGFRCAADLESQ